MSSYRMAFVGFGNVGQALMRLLLRKQELLKAQYDITFSVTGIYTGRHGAAIDPIGISADRALAIAREGGRLDTLSAQPAPHDGVAFVRACPADVLFENSPVNVQTGQPALDHLKTALEGGMHAITANKGPVVHGYRLLKETAAAHGRKFMFESTVMDGAPIFSLFRGALPAVELRGFRGILNSCTNMILTHMEQGETFDQAVAYAQSIGIAETDPSGDIDGWDASIKVAALVTVLMGLPFTPQQVERTGIRGITPAMLSDARAQGKRWKLVCSAHRDGDAVTGRVTPEMVSPDSVLYSINGTSSYAQFETDVLPGLGVVESDPSPETTAFGLLADFLNAVR
ncbi:MAG TPA: homoserine dehydrogenase [Anaerolineaceae bacterium]